MGLIKVLFFVNNTLFTKVFTKSKVLFLSYHIKNTNDQRDSSQLMLTLIIWL